MARYEFLDAWSRLGRSGLLSHRMVLGTMNFGVRTPQDESFHIMSEALEAGINVFDTANVYGRSVYKGATEDLIGRWFAEDPGRRERVVLATKVFSPMTRWPNDSLLSARHIVAAANESLRRLGTDRIDIYQIHHMDPGCPWEKIWQAMDVLIHQGKILYVGGSNCAAWYLVQGQEIAKRLSLNGFISEQSLYNLLERRVELEVLPACRAYGFAFLAYSPLAGGGLSGWSRATGHHRGASDFTAGVVRDRLQQILAFEALASAWGIPEAPLAVSWLLGKPGVTPVMGPRTRKQLSEILVALEIRLEPNQLDQLDAIGGGPAREAPCAYAW